MKGTILYYRYSDGSGSGILPRAFNASETLLINQVLNWIQETAGGTAANLELIEVELPEEES